MELPNISDQIYKAISYYYGHTKAINSEYVDGDDVKEYVWIWLNIQYKLALKKHNAKLRKELGIPD